MGELLRDVSEMIWQRPVLWLPVLVADLLGFLLNIARLSVLRAYVAHRMQQQSVFGGASVRGPLTASTVEAANAVGIPVTWFTYLLRLLLYATALVVTAALVRGFLLRERQPGAQIAPAVRSHAGGIVSLSGWALAVYAVAALLYASVTTQLVHHGHRALLASPWLSITVGALVFAVLSFLLAPAAVQMLANRPAPPDLKARAQLYSFVLALVALALNQFVGANIRTLHGASVAARYVLELTGSWITALPYVVLFVGLSVLASQTAQREPLAATNA